MFFEREFNNTIVRVALPQALHRVSPIWIDYAQPGTEQRSSQRWLMFWTVGLSGSFYNLLKQNILEDGD